MQIISKGMKELVHRSASGMVVYQREPDGWSKAYEVVDKGRTRAIFSYKDSAIAYIQTAR